MIATVIIIHSSCYVFSIFGLDCSLLGAIAMHYAHLRLGLGLGLGSGLGLALVFSET